MKLYFSLSLLKGFDPDNVDENLLSVELTLSVWMLSFSFLDSSEELHDLEDNGESSSVVEFSSILLFS